ncbi:MAG TPA: DUF2141 domain-containing protein [Rhizomicrobium sp.]|nr:DUF2141 domain-containing protein [Rhizomicrobium sp.]
MGLRGIKVRNFQRFLALPAAIVALAGLLAATPAAAQEPATLVIHVENIAPKGGILRLGLYDEARYPDDDSTPVASADVPAQIGETVITLTNITPGTYAIETYQDVNSNDKMDTTWLGIPLEPFGFSHDARPHLSKPAFAQVKFVVTPGVNVQILHLQNSISLIATK